VTLIFAPLFSTLPGAIALIPIVALLLSIDTLREFFFSLMRALENMQWEAGIFLLTNAAIVIFGFAFLRIEISARSFSWGYVAGDALGTIVAAIALRSYFKRSFHIFRRSASCRSRRRVALRDQRRPRISFHEQRYPHHQLDAFRLGCGHILRRHPHHPDVLPYTKHHPVRDASRHWTARKNR